MNHLRAFRNYPLGKLCLKENVSSMTLTFIRKNLLSLKKLNLTLIINILSQLSSVVQRGDGIPGIDGDPEALPILPSNFHWYCKDIDPFLYNLVNIQPSNSTIFIKSAFFVY